MSRLTCHPRVDRLNIHQCSECFVNRPTHLVAPYPTSPFGKLRCMKSIKNAIDNDHNRRSEPFQSVFSYIRKSSFTLESSSTIGVHPQGHHPAMSIRNERSVQIFQPPRIALSRRPGTRPTACRRAARTVLSNSSTEERRTLRHLPIDGFDGFPRGVDGQLHALTEFFGRSYPSSGFVNPHRWRLSTCPATFDKSMPRLNAAIGRQISATHRAASHRRRPAVRTHSRSRCGIYHVDISGRSQPRRGAGPGSGR
jgi:hypothetical protein